MIIEIRDQLFNIFKLGLIISIKMNPGFRPGSYGGF